MTCPRVLLADDHRMMEKVLKPFSTTSLSLSVLLRMAAQ